MWRDGLSRLFKYGNRDLSLDAGEVVKELIKRLAALQVVKEIFHRHTSAGKHGHTALHLRVDRDEGVVHWPIIRRQSPEVANVGVKPRAVGTSA